MRYLNSPSREGFVYLMLNRRNGFTKIGFSKDPVFRERTLQSEEPEIKMLAKWRAFPVDEEEMHLRFAHKRLRGEWFNLTRSERREIGNYLSSGELGIEAAERLLRTGSIAS